MKNKLYNLRSYLIKTNYLNHHSIQLLIGSILLIAPAFFAILLIVLWKNLDFLWAPLLFGTIGYVLVLPSMYVIARPLEKRAAINVLLIGLMVMLCLCSFIIPLRLERQSSEILTSRREKLDFQNPTNEHLNQLRLHFEEAFLALEEKEIEERETP